MCGYYSRDGQRRKISLTTLSLLACSRLPEPLSGEEYTSELNVPAETIDPTALSVAHALVTALCDQLASAPYWGSRVT